ncbi:MAG: RluA family pseudouridine synthase [Acutalibacteraceae bacterium]
MEILKFLSEECDSGLRVDKFLIKKTNNFSRAYLQKLIESGNVELNGHSINKSFKISENQQIIVKIPEAENPDVKPENIDLDIIYEDNDLLVVNKPKGMVVHPAPGNFNHTLVNALMYHCKNSLSGINGVLRPGIIHRIDKDTSGLLIVAKNDTAHRHLAEQIKNHSFTRVYEAVVNGVLLENYGTITTNIARHKTNRKKMAVCTGRGKLAVTHYEVIKRFEKYTHLKLKLETGRTHQIRVHMSNIGHYVLGDEVYGRKNKNFNFLIGQCLHARTIGFIHPSTGKYMEFESDLPEYFKKILSVI